MRWLLAFGRQRGVNHAASNFTRPGKQNSTVSGWQLGRVFPRTDTIRSNTGSREACFSLANHPLRLIFPFGFTRLETNSLAERTSLSIR